MKKLTTFLAFLLLTVLFGSQRGYSQSADIPMVKCDLTSTATMFVTAQAGAIAIEPGITYQFKGDAYEGQTDLFKVDVYFRGSYKESFWVCDAVRTAALSKCSEENDGWVAGGIGSNGPTGGNRYGFKYKVNKDWYCSGLSKSNLTAELKFDIEWYRSANSNPKHSECFTFPILQSDIASSLANSCPTFPIPATGFEYEVCEGWTSYIPLPTQDKTMADALMNSGLYVAWFKEANFNNPISWGPNGVDQEHYWNYGWDYRNYFDAASNPGFHANGELVRYIRYYTENSFCGARVYCGGFIKVRFVPAGLKTATPAAAHVEYFCGTEGVNKTNSNGDVTKHYRVRLPELTDGFQYYWYDSPPLNPSTVPTPIATGRYHYLEANATGTTTAYVAKYKKEATWEGGCEYFSPTSTVIAIYPPDYVIPLEDFMVLDGTEENPNCQEPPITQAPPPYIYTDKLLVKADKPTLDQILPLPYLPCANGQTVFDIRWMEVVDGKEKGFVNFDQEGIPLIQPSSGYAYRKFCYSNVKGNYEDQRLVGNQWHYTRQLRAYVSYELAAGCATKVKYCALPLMNKRYTLYGDMCEDEDLGGALLEQMTTPGNSNPIDLTICNNVPDPTDLSSLEMQVACKDGTTDLTYEQSVLVNPVLYDVNQVSYTWEPVNGGYITPTNAPNVTVDYNGIPANGGEFLQYVAQATYPSLLATQADLVDKYCIMVYKCEKECRENLDGTTKPYTPVLNHGLSNAISTNGNTTSTGTSIGDESFQQVTSSIADKGAYSNVRTFPNPVENVLNIKFDQNFNGSISIMDVNGRTVKTQIIKNSSKIEMDFKEFKAGFYIGTGIDVDGSSFKFKFLKN